MNHYLLTPGPDEDGLGFLKKYNPLYPPPECAPVPLQPLHALHLGASLAGT